MPHPFAALFSEAWKQPTPERLAALLHADVVLFQPHRPPIRARTQALDEFSRLLSWLPTLHGNVIRSSGTEDIVFIEWEMRLTVGARCVSIPAVDRFRLANGIGIERTVYFDQLALIKLVLRHPSLWAGYLKYRFGTWFA